MSSSSAANSSVCVGLTVVTSLTDLPKTFGVGGVPVLELDAVDGEDTGVVISRPEPSPSVYRYLNLPLKAFTFPSNTLAFVYSVKASVVRRG